MKASRGFYIFACAIAFLLGDACGGFAQVSNQTVYTDSLQNGWSDYSWATVNFSATNQIHTGADSISVNCGAYQALYLHHTVFSADLYTNLTFWIYPAAGGAQALQVNGTLSGKSQSSFYQIPSLTTGKWNLINVPLSALGVSDAPNMDGFWIQSQSASAQPIFYVDDIALLANTNFEMATNPTANIIVDANANRHPISPLIYGVAFASQAQVADLNVPINRSGGNAETRYNWQIDAHNHANDYYFESIEDSSSGTPGAADDSFISSTKAAGAKPLITVPMIGWAPILGPGRGKLGSYSVAKYGPQTSTDQYLPDAGNGISVTNNRLITWNNPTDANVAVDVNFEKSWLQHLTNKWGLSTNGGVGYYLMDNEHTLWFSTHRDIHPVGTTMQEIFRDFTNYATMVKSVDSNALVLGPEEWGWNGYLYSGYDQQWSGAHNDYNSADYPDRKTNGGWDYMPWLLNQLHQHDVATGVRLLDYFTLHCYPQEGSVSSQTAVDAETQLLRNSTTRQFWDSNYVDPSYINSVIDLIPRMQGWVTNYYPGTKIGITEYNWGAEPYMNGATAQADLLGIFGRQSLDLATRWTTPDASTPTYLAIKMYRNYDGAKSTFGDTSVSASGPNPDNVAAFAAERASDGALTVMVISKYLSGITPMTLAVTNFTGTGLAQVWQLNSSNTIARLSDAVYSGGKLTTTVPGQSVTLFILAAAKSFALAAGPVREDGNISVTLNGQMGQTYVLQVSTNNNNWVSLSTNIMGSSPTNFLFPAGYQKAFFRAKQL
jgi:hypothetical protein